MKLKCMPTANVHYCMRSIYENVGIVTLPTESDNFENKVGSH